jgi:hypothetical protein
MRERVRRGEIDDDIDGQAEIDMHARAWDWDLDDPVERAAWSGLGLSQ